MVHVAVTKDQPRVLDRWDKYWDDRQGHQSAADLEFCILSSSNSRCVAIADVQAQLESPDDFSTAVTH